MSARQDDDPALATMLDGNAIAGDLAMIFGRDMSGDSTECAHCGQTHAVGGLLAFVGGPGIVLRCPSCTAIVLRVVRTPRATYIDARGSAVMQLNHSGGSPSG